MNYVSSKGGEFYALNIFKTQTRKKGKENVRKT